jgi:SAM-dependent methyltransferase
MAKYFDSKQSNLPFISEGCFVENNFMQYTYSSLVELVPNGCGVCLDLWAGSVTHKDAIETKGWLWVGVDPGFCPKLSVRGSALGLPIKSESIDMIFCNQVLEHLTHPIQALLEAFRVLRPSGQIIGSASFLEPWHESCYGFSHWGIEQILSDCGFQLIKIRPGTSVFVVLAAHLFPDTNLGPKIGGLFGRFTMGFLKWFGGCCMAFEIW